MKVLTILFFVAILIGTTFVSGCTGDTGPQGEQGSQGEQGLMGPQGPSGIPGVQLASDFTANQTSGITPLTVQFADQSTGTGAITDWEWDFNNDGEVDSIDQNPSHIYTDPGEYTVSLKIIGPDGSDRMTKTNYINVPYPSTVAQFTADQTSGLAPLTIQFSDQSSGGITDWAWDFNNDGLVDSTDQNPSYTYEVLGTHTVSLSVAGHNGSDIETKTDYIVVHGQFEVVVEKVNVLGDPNSIVIDSQGDFAYLSSGYALLVLDLTTLQLTANYPLIDAGDDVVVDDIDDSDSLVLLHGFSRISIADVDEGSVEEIMSSSAVYGAVLSNGFIYATSFNGRVVVVSSIDGTIQETIDPYADSSEVAGPRFIASNADGSKVVFTDDFHNNLHVIQTSDNTIIATIAIGFEPGPIMFLDNDTVVVCGGDGIIALVDLTNPMAVPEFFQVESLELVSSLAVDPSGARLFVLHRKLVGHGLDRSGYPSDVYQPELVVIDLSTQSIISRMVLDEDEAVAPASYDLGLTPDGNTLLVVGATSVYVLE